MKYLAVLILALFSVGCAGSLEEARAPKRLAAAPPPSEHCISLDATRRDWHGVGLGFAALAGGSGLSTIPAKSNEAEIALASGAAVAIGFAALAEGISTGAGTSWARECSTP